MIRVEGLWHHYGVRPILEDLSFTVETGELVVLLGPNGTGKSTLLGCLAGVLWPQCGYVAFDGVRRRESVEGERAIRQKTFYLTDDPWLPFDVTGREYLLAIARLYEVDEFRAFEHADRLLALFHLVGKQDAPVRSYSTGQKKKIGLASALITEAPYLLLDEPFSGGLDPAGIFALKQVLKRLATDRDVTVVMTTPVPEIVAELADRVAVIRDRRIVAFDTPAGLVSLADEARLDAALNRLMYPDSDNGLRSYFDTPLEAGGEG